MGKPLTQPDQKFIIKLQSCLTDSVVYFQIPINPSKSRLDFVDKYLKPSNLITLPDLMLLV